MGCLQSKVKAFLISTQWITGQIIYLDVFKKRDFRITPG